MSDTVQRAIDAAVHAFRREIEGWLEDYGDLFGSPIEEGLFIAVASMFRLSLEPFIVVRSAAQMDEASAVYRNFTIIYPQATVGKYKADFRFFCWLGGRLAGSFVVECDGHDYHDRTKEQASRDRARDRFMQGHNLKVLRFTGADIYRDPLACASEVLAAVEDFRMPARSV